MSYQFGGPSYLPLVDVEVLVDRELRVIAGGPDSPVDGLMFEDGGLIIVGGDDGGDESGADIFSEQIRWAHPIVVFALSLSEFQNSLKCNVRMK